MWNCNNYLIQNFLGHSLLHFIILSIPLVNKRINSEVNVFQFPEPEFDRSQCVFSRQKVKSKLQYEGCMIVLLISLILPPPMGIDTRGCTLTPKFGAVLVIFSLFFCKFGSIIPQCWLSIFTTDPIKTEILISKENLNIQLKYSSSSLMK